MALFDAQNPETRPPAPSRRPSMAVHDRTAPPPPPRPAGPPLFLVEFSGDPIYDHPLWSEHPNVIPSARVEIRFKTDQRGMNTWEPAAGPADTTYGFMATVARLMDGFERARPGRRFRWFGIPAAFGRELIVEERKKCPNVVPLLNHPADRLKSGRRGPFFAEGARRNAAWSKEFFEHLAAEVAFRRIPDPLAFILTSEHGVGDDYQGHEGEPDRGWVPEALADPRASDPEHLIDGRRTFAQYMADSRALDGAPVPAYRDKVPLGIPPGRAPMNDESSERYRGAIRLAWDWSREIAFAQFARAAFRRSAANPHATVKVGEYEAACDSPWSPVRVRPRTLLHQMDGVFHSDVQCPGWYGGVSWNRREPIFDTEAGWESVNNWLREYPNSEKDPARRERRVALDVQKAIATAHARSAPASPLMPFVSHYTGAPEDDMVEYLRHCRSQGAWGTCLFWHKPDRAAHDYWARVVPRVCA